MKNKLLAGLFLVFVIGGGYFAWQKVKEESARDEIVWETTADVAVRTIEETIEANGFVHPRFSTNVRSEVSGRIDRILVEPGEGVERGQILIELDRAARMNVIDALRDVLVTGKAAQTNTSINVYESSTFHYSGLRFFSGDRSNLSRNGGLAVYSRRCPLGGGHPDGRVFELGNGTTSDRAFLR